MNHLKKEYIIKESRIFDEMIQTCPCKKNKNFLIFYRKKEQEEAKYGISSPKKLGKAVIRNKLRRRVRAILQEYQKSYSNPYDCIIIIRKNCLNITFQEMKDSLFYLLKLEGKR